MADFISPGASSDPRGQRVAVVLGDTETAEASDMLEHAAAAHGIAVASGHFFYPGAVEEAGSAIAVPAVVGALVTAARNAWGLWIPYPQDLGSAVESVSIIGIAANLGIPMHVSPHAVNWQTQVLPGLATTEVIAAIGIATRAFLAAASGDLLVAELARNLVFTQDAS